MSACFLRLCICLDPLVIVDATHIEALDLLAYTLYIRLRTLERFDTPSP
jgi:hypothetical protein